MIVAKGWWLGPSGGGWLGQGMVGGGMVGARCSEWGALVGASASGRARASTRSGLVARGGRVIEAKSSRSSRGSRNLQIVVLLKKECSFSDGDM